MQSAPVKVHGSVVGWIEVGYSESRPILDEGPFMKEERLLIDALAERIGHIIERKRGEEALKESEEKFHSLFINMAEGAAIHELSYDDQGVPEDYVIIETNPAFEKQLGIARDNVIGKTSREAYGIIEPPYLEIYAQVTQTGEPQTFETYFPPLEKHFSISSYRSTNDRFVTIFEDISERKQAEEALRDSEQRLRSIYNTAGDVIFYLEVEEGEQYRFSLINEAFCKTTGLTRTEVIGQRVHEIIPEPSLSMVLGKYRQAIAEKAIIRWEETSNYPNGLLIAIASIAPVFDNKGCCTHLVGSVHDITDSKRLEEEQQRVAKLESVGLLAGGIAHDFNNILTAILGNISLAKMEATPGSEIHSSLEQAEKASQRARELTKQLLTFSRGGAPVKKLTSLTELLNNTATFALRGSNVKCRFSLSDDLWSAEIDSGQVSQIIHNLVINAQQAMPKGGAMKIRAENITINEIQSLGKILPLSGGNYIRIAVSDHGSGIPAENLNRIFDPFFTTKQKGSGLGLATSFSIALQHGGHLSVESEVGIGSTFYLYLPASFERIALLHEKSEQIKAVGTTRILVMDDEAQVRLIASRMLNRLGYNDIELALDGTGAINLYKKALDAGNPFRVVILDLTVPGGMGGEETVQRLLVIDPEVKAIVSSGYAADPVIANYGEYGFLGMVAKPYTLEELSKALQSLIG